MNNIRIFLTKLKKSVVNLLVRKKEPLWKEWLQCCPKNRKKFFFISGSIVVIFIALILIYGGKNEAYDGGYFKMRSEYYVEPFTIVKGLENAILVDVRPRDRYDEKHIIDAQHLEVAVDEKTGAIKNTKEIGRKLKEMASQGETVIIYGENAYSHIPSDVASIGVQAGVKMKLLEVGWNEFRHFSAFWVPEKVSAKINILDYLESTDRK